MEFLGAFLDEEWENLNRMLSGEDSGSDHMISLQHSHGFSNEFDDGRHSYGNTNSMVDDQGSLMFYASDVNIPPNPNLYYCVSQENSNYSNNDQFSDPNYNIADINPAANNNMCDQIIISPSSPIDFCTKDDDVSIINLLLISEEDIPYLKQDDVEGGSAINYTAADDDPSSRAIPIPVKRKFEMTQVLSPEDETNGAKTNKNPKKKTKDHNLKTKRHVVQPKKKPRKGITADHNNTNIGKEISEGEEYTSKDDLNANSPEGSSIIRGVLIHNDSSTLRKTRACRGAATDPPSIYARKRRERINERLRILQNLVPNGTKVDISTMLEEAVHYVKFLQLQIKLLSSDDMWMYAPIAYNGMDMGLYQRIAPTL